MLLIDLGAVGEWSFIEESTEITMHLLIEYPYIMETYRTPTSLPIPVISAPLYREGNNKIAASSR